MDSHIYQVDLKYLNERKGEISSPVLNQKIEVATPPEFPKGMPGIWSPEHLFTAAVSSCFMTTFLAIAENSKLEFESFACKASGKLEQVDGKYKMTEVLLEPQLVILHEQDQARALRVLEKAEAACLITNSITSTVTMKPTIVISGLVSVL